MKVNTDDAGDFNSQPAELAEFMARAKATPLPASTCPEFVERWEVHVPVARGTEEMPDERTYTSTDKRGYVDVVLNFTDIKDHSARVSAHFITAYSMDMEPLMDELQLLFSGRLKWDGCANLDFGEDNVMVHFCGLECVDRLNRALKLMYASGGDLFKSWQGSSDE